MTYAATVVVSPVGTAVQNGAALLGGLASITTASATQPFLLKIEPGQYDLGASAIFLKDFVDVEGSGQDATTIISAASTTILAGNNMELRQLSVINSGSATFQVGVGCYAAAVGFRMTSVTATASGSGMFVEALSGHGTFTSCTLIASGTSGAQGAGMFDNSNSASVVRDSLLRGNTYSVQIQSGSVNLANTELDGPASTGGGLTCVDCYNQSFTPVGPTCM